MGRIAFTWGASSWHGWGVIGLNLMLYWEGGALSLTSDLAAELSPADPRQGLLAERLQESVRLQRDLAERPGSAPSLPVWEALGNEFVGTAMPWQMLERGRVAFPVFEDLALAEKHIERLKPYNRVIAASRWNQEFLVAHGVDAKLCHQGYDPLLFHPGVRRQRDDGRFRVFSGGKCEWRKGQDLVLQAFARFAEAHDDAVLVAAWGSPWPGLARSFAVHGIYPPPGSTVERPNFRAWAHQYGIKPHQIEIVRPMPNWRMPEVYGGVDCALFPNRFEGGTNLVAMEAMACGVPAFVRHETGQCDLPAGRICYGDADAVDAQVDFLGSFYNRNRDSFELRASWSWPERLAELRSILAGA